MSVIEKFLTFRILELPAKAAAAAGGFWGGGGVGGWVVSGIHDIFFLGVKVIARRELGKLWEWPLMSESFFFSEQSMNDSFLLMNDNFHREFASWGPYILTHPLLLLGACDQCPLASTPTQEHFCFYLSPFLKRGVTNNCLWGCTCKEIMISLWLVSFKNKQCILALSPLKLGFISQRWELGWGRGESVEKINW